MKLQKTTKRDKTHKHLPTEIQVFILLLLLDHSSKKLHYVKLTFVNNNNGTLQKHELRQKK